MQGLEIINYAIGPIALISGVGLILLTLVNRLARVIDIDRKLLDTLDHINDESERKARLEEIKFIHKRARLLKHSLTYIVMSIVSTSIMVFSIVFSKLFDIDCSTLSNVLLILSLSFIVICALYFLMEVRLTLAALEINYKKKLA